MKLGRWHTVYSRFSRWRSKGVWQRVVNALAQHTEIGHVLIDSTVVRAHQHSARALRKWTTGVGAFPRRIEYQAALGRRPRQVVPLRRIITEGQVTDISCATERVEHLRTKAFIADKGYDSDTFVSQIRAAGAKAVIPPRSNRKTKRRCSRVLYRTRNLIECFFNRIKHFRPVSTRYDKLADSYLVFASLACPFGPLVNVDTS